jgi:hypothetical protein
MLTARDKSISVAADHLNELLDEALEETFPASDPVAITVEAEPPLAAPASRPPPAGAEDRGPHHKA